MRMSEDEDKKDENENFGESFVEGKPRNETEGRLHLLNSVRTCFLVHVHVKYCSDTLFITSSLSRELLLLFFLPFDSSLRVCERKRGITRN